MISPPGEFEPWRGVFETVRVHEGTPLFASDHLVELKRAARVLGLPLTFDLKAERAKLPEKSGRWRWIVTREGNRTLFTKEDVSTTRSMALSVSPVRVGSQNWDALYKTLSHLAFTQAWQTASTPEVVLLNEHGHVASASRSNIFWRKGERVSTPAHEAGCRRGVVRGFVSARTKVVGGHYPLEDLLAADEIFLTNSIRGIVSVDQLNGKKLADFSRADKLRRDYEMEIAHRLS